MSAQKHDDQAGPESAANKSFIRDKYRSGAKNYKGPVRSGSVLPVIEFWLARSRPVLSFVGSIWSGTFFVGPVRFGTVFVSPVRSFLVPPGDFFVGPVQSVPVSRWNRARAR